MLIDSGSQHNLLSAKIFEYLCGKHAKVWNIRSESQNQLRPYDGNIVLKIKAVFEAVIDLVLVSNLICSFYVIENEGQLSRDTAIKLGVFKLAEV